MLGPARACSRGRRTGRDGRTWRRGIGVLECWSDSSACFISPGRRHNSPGDSVRSYHGRARPTHRGLMKYRQRVMASRLYGARSPVPAGPGRKNRQNRPLRRTSHGRRSLHPSSFCLHPSAFVLQPSSFGRGYQDPPSPPLGCREPLLVQSVGRLLSCPITPALHPLLHYSMAPGARLRCTPPRAGAPPIRRLAAGARVHAWRRRG
jgi:hypothetical protein